MWPFFWQVNLMAKFMDETERERESEMSHFARPQKSRRVQEKARMGRPFGFTAWSNEENGDTEK